MTYRRFNTLIDEFENQFVIHTKDGRILFLRTDSFYNEIGGVLATNEKTFELEIIQYDEIDYAVVDGNTYK